MWLMYCARDEMGFSPLFQITETAVTLVGEPVESSGQHEHICVAKVFGVL